MFLHPSTEDIYTRVRVGQDKSSASVVCEGFHEDSDGFSLTRARGQFDRAGQVRLDAFCDRHCLFDLDARTVERKPGDYLRITDALWPLRSIEACEIGSRGLWALWGNDYLNDYYWHSSSVIQRIGRID